MNSKENNETILVTGAAGFIGSALSKALLNLNFKVIGIDNLNDYYPVKIKKERLKDLNKFKHFRFNKLDLKNNKELKKIFKGKKIDITK